MRLFVELAGRPSFQEEKIYTYPTVRFIVMAYTLRFTHQYPGFFARNMTITCAYAWVNSRFRQVSTSWNCRGSEGALMLRQDNYQGSTLEFWGHCFGTFLCLELFNAIFQRENSPENSFISELDHFKTEVTASNISVLANSVENSSNNLAEVKIVKFHPFWLRSTRVF